MKPRVGTLWTDYSNSYENLDNFKTKSAKLSYTLDRKDEYGITRRPVADYLPRVASASSLIPDDEEKTCVFVGYAEWKMDGRILTRGELDRTMHHVAKSKFPCSRPATLDEYAAHRISGLPSRNETGKEIIFVGPNSDERGDGTLDHKNTLLARKKAVLPKDRLDGTASVSAIAGVKMCICVFDLKRVRLQPSLSQFGYARFCLDDNGEVLPELDLQRVPSCDTRWSAPRDIPTVTVSSGNYSK
eukprot:GEMP01062231.1.p1 GENE.GEMP01062231.1~~GEMP01062231.1.p1  ORF type:complete len:244 (+),score=42.44 GEMP01062231.1:155-886(+)